MPRLWSRAASPTRCALRWRSSRKSFALPATRTYYRSSCLETIRASRLAGSCLPMARALQTDRDLCPRVLLRGSRGVFGPVSRRRRGCQAAPVEPEGVRAAERRARDRGGVGRQIRRLVKLVDASIQTAGRSRAYSSAMPYRMALSKGLPPLRFQLQQQVSQLGALAGKARLGSLVHPPPLTAFLGAWAHAVVPVHHLLEQLGGHARIG